MNEPSDKGEEVLFARSVPRARRRQLRRLARGIYTTNRVDADTAIVRRNWRTIIANVAPNAVIVGRSALHRDPFVNGRYLFIDHPRARALELPGVTVVPTDGGGPRPGDLDVRAHTGTPLWTSSPQRTIIDNLAPSRASANRPSPTAGRDATAQYIAEFAVRTRGQPARLADLRRHVADALADDQMRSVDAWFTAAAGDRTVRLDVQAPLLHAIQRGEPYDPDRLERFELLAQAFQGSAPVQVEAPPESHRRSLAFYEAYFSNYIEGTVFRLEEAEDIIFRGHRPSARHQDAHDLEGTWLIASARPPRTPFSDPKEYIRTIRRWHSLLMDARPDVRPGEFKTERNQVGSHTFVDPALVVGTLTAGFDIAARQRDPFGRAAILGYVTTEVHPFNDGNGRVSRLVMNHELSAADQSRVIIPTVSRNEYLRALSALSNNDRADAYISVLSFAQRWTRAIDFSDHTTATRQMTGTNAFELPLEAEQRGVHLRMPADRDGPSDVPRPTAPTPIGRNVPSLSGRPAAGCGATTRDGGTCTRITGGGRCWQHQ